MDDVSNPGVSVSFGSYDKAVVDGCQDVENYAVEVGVLSYRVLDKSFQGVRVPKWPWEGD